MVSMRATHTKSQTTYYTKGKLEDVVKKCEDELVRKENSKEYGHLKWQYEKSKKEYERYKNRISDLNGFIKLAKEKLREEENNG